MASPKEEQKKQIIQQEEAAGVNQGNLEGRVDSTKNPGEQGGDDMPPRPATPREQGRRADGPSVPGERAPESDEASEEDTTTANAPNAAKNRANDPSVVTHKENAMKAESKPKNEAADAPGNRAKSARSRSAEEVGDEADEDEDDRGPRDEQPEHTIPEGMGTTRIRITKATRALNVAGTNVLEELRRPSLNVGDELVVADNVATHLVDANRAVVLDGEGEDAEVGTRQDVMRHNRDNPSPVRTRRTPEEQVEDEEENAKPRLAPKGSAAKAE